MGVVHQAAPITGVLFLPVGSLQRLLARPIQEQREYCAALLRTMRATHDPGQCATAGFGRRCSHRDQIPTTVTLVPGVNVFAAWLSSQADGAEHLERSRYWRRY